MRGHSPDAVSVVRLFGALQAQDYPAAVWAIAQRRTSTASARSRRHRRGLSGRAGSSVLTCSVRPGIWSPPDDLRWLLELTGPRVNRANSSRPTGRSISTRRHSLAPRICSSAALAEGPRRRPNSARRSSSRIPGLGSSSGLRPHGGRARPADLQRGVPRQAARLRPVRRSGAAPRPRSTGTSRCASSPSGTTRYGPATIVDLSWWSGRPSATPARRIAAADDALETAGSTACGYGGRRARGRGAASDRPPAGCTCCLNLTSTRSPIATARI